MLRTLSSQHITKITSSWIHILSVYHTIYRTAYFFSRFPPPESRNPFANGLLSIFSCVIYKKIRTDN